MADAAASEIDGGIAGRRRPGPGPLKYAVVERERRYLVATLPRGVTGTREIVDHYVSGTRLRLREVRHPDGTVVRKLGHKVRLGAGPREVACTNLYLDDQEWDVLLTLPARTLRKRRHLVARDGWVVAIDEHEDGSLVAEIDDDDEPSDGVPEWLDVLRDVSDDEAWTGSGRAARHGPPAPGARPAPTDRPATGLGSSGSSGTVGA